MCARVFHQCVRTSKSMRAVAMATFDSLRKRHRARLTGTSAQTRRNDLNLKQYSFKCSQFAQLFT